MEKANGLRCLCKTPRQLILGPIERTPTGKVDTVRVMNYDMCKRDLPRLLSRAAHAGANRLPDRSPLNPQIMARG